VSATQRAYKTELDLNNVQTTACRKHAGAARWAYNWGLQRKQEAYRTTGKSPSAIELHRELNALKHTEIHWMYEVSKCAPQEALRNLDRAFDGFFLRAALQKAGKHKGKVGFSRFKSKKRGLGSFRLTGSIVVFPEAIQLPRLGRLRLKERGYLPTTGTPGIKVLSATVSEQAGHWCVSVLVEQEWVVPENMGPVVGVDLGMKTLAMLSDGTVEPNPRHLKQRLRQIKRCQRAVSHKQQGSHNRSKAVQRLARLHRHVANQRASTLHQFTSRLAKTKSVVVIEDLNVAGMLKNPHLAQAIGDVGWGEFRRQLTYKADWYGCRVVVASRWEPSSRTCSGCGWVDEDLSLADRVFACHNPARPDCGLVIDRDLNAAINLSKLAGSSSDSLNARGEGSAGGGLVASVKLPSMKQEPDTLDASA
jgi:IS605 OrfB family transposase